MANQTQNELLLDMFQKLINQGGLSAPASTATVSKLTGEKSYEEWFFSVTAHLEKLNILKFIEEDVPQPAEENKLELWKKQRNECLSAFWDTTTPVRNRLDNAGYKPTDRNPFKLMQVIKKTIGTADIAHLSPTVKELTRMKREDFISTTAMLNRFFYLQKRIDTVTTISEPLLCSFLLNAIETFNKTLYNKYTIKKEPTMEKLRKDFAKIVATEVNLIGLESKTKSPGQKKDRKKDDKRKSKGKRNSCKWCDDPHSSDNCYLMFPEKTPADWNMAAWKPKVKAWRASERGRKAVAQASREGIPTSSLSPDNVRFWEGKQVDRDEDQEEEPEFEALFIDPPAVQLEGIPYAPQLKTVPPSTQQEEHSRYAETFENRRREPEKRIHSEDEGFLTPPVTPAQQQTHHQPQAPQKPQALSFQQYQSPTAFDKPEITMDDLVRETSDFREGPFQERFMAQTPPALRAETQSLLPIEDYSPLRAESPPSAEVAMLPPRAEPQPQP